MKSLILVTAVALAGCGGDGGGAADLASARDATVDDLAAALDLARPDLAPPADLTPPRDLAPPADLAQPGCGLLTFENALGTVGNPGKVSRSSPVTLDGVVFTSANGDAILNVRDTDGPFSSDYLELWTYAAGATIKFPKPIVRIKFDAGQHAVTSPAVVDVIAGGRTIGKFTCATGSHAPTAVAFDLPSAVDTVLLVFKTGSVSLVGIDNLQYTAASCP